MLSTTRTRKRFRSTNVLGRPMKRPRTSFKRSGAPPATRGFRGGYGRSPREKKTYDLAASTDQCNTTGAFSLLCVPILGTDYTNRIGRKIIMKSVYIRGFVRSEPSSTAGQVGTCTAQQIRIIIFIDFQPNGTAPSVTDLLTGATTVSHLNLNYRDRFKILKDKIIVLDPYIVNATSGTSVAAATNQIKNVKIYKKLNQEVIFNATNGGDIADINSGALWMLTIGSVPAGTNTDANAVLTTRVRFIDA